MECGSSLTCPTTGNSISHRFTESSTLLVMQVFSLIHNWSEDLLIYHQLQWMPLTIHLIVGLSLMRHFNGPEYCSGKLNWNCFQNWYSAHQSLLSKGKLKITTPCFRLVLADTASGTTTQVCTGIAGIREGNRSTCQLKYPCSLVHYGDYVYTGGNRALMQMRGNAMKPLRWRNIVLLMYAYS